MQEINCFSKMADFVNFEAVEDRNIDEIYEIEDIEGNMFENVKDVELIFNENKFGENVEDYYAFTNVSRSVEVLHYVRFLYWFWLFSGSK